MKIKKILNKNVAMFLLIISGIGIIGLLIIDIIF